MKYKNKIWFIKACIIWPVGSAGAVVIAPNKKRAAELPDKYLENPSEPVCIGVTNKEESCIFCNNTEY